MGNYYALPDYTDDELTALYASKYSFAKLHKVSKVSSYITVRCLDGWNHLFTWPLTLAFSPIILLLGLYYHLRPDPVMIIQGDIEFQIVIVWQFLDETRLLWCIFIETNRFAKQIMYNFLYVVSLSIGALLVATVYVCLFIALGPLFIICWPAFLAAWCDNN